MLSFNSKKGDFHGGTMDKNLQASAGDSVLSLLWDDSTRCGATNPCHTYWARTLETTEHKYWACVPQMKRLWTALKSSPLAVIREGPNKDPAQANKKKKNEWMNEF